jgi:hypothetical protein
MMATRGGLSRGRPSVLWRDADREQVVELADAVAACDGIATGIGANHSGAQLIVDVGSREA